MAEFIAHHSLFTSGLIAIDHFTLYSSHLGSGGSVYRVENTYPLG